MLWEAITNNLADFSKEKSGVRMVKGLPEDLDSIMTERFSGQEPRV